MEYNIAKPWESLDPWQEEVLSDEGNIVLRSGRQTGKSAVISIKAGEMAVHQKGKQIMVIAAVERQALLLFEKILSYIHSKYKNYIKGGKDRPTRHKIQLTNGSTIICLPTGETGYGIRGHTIDLLIADEAAFINEEVWTAITPMLAITKGKMWLLSTPFGREGFFYRCFSDDKFKSYHVSSEDCPRKDEEFLRSERERMTKAQYAQEYLGEFVDDLMQFFTDKLIRKCQTLKRRDEVLKGRKYFLGVDVGGMGGDASTFEIIDATNTDKLYHIEHDQIERVYTTDTTRKIINYDKEYNFNKILVDDGGIGFGVFSELMDNNSTRRKTIAINNASRPVDRQGRSKKIMKEELYNNLLNLMEKGKIQLLDDSEVFQSLKSIQVEYKDGKMKLFGKNTHIVEGLVRAAWGIKTKRLNIWIR